MMTTAPIIGAPIPRWPGAHPARRPSVASWGGAMLLHVAVGAVVLTAVRLAVAPPASGNHTIALGIRAGPARRAACAQRADANRGSAPGHTGTTGLQTAASGTGSAS